MATAVMPVTTLPLWRAGEARRSARPARQPPQRGSHGHRLTWPRYRCHCRCGRRRRGYGVPEFCSTQVKIVWRIQWVLMP